MNSVQFGHWIGERRLKYGFRSQRALAEHVSGDPTLNKLDITENFLARLEAGSFAYPFRGSVRVRVAALAWLLCATPRDVNVYYQAAGLTELDDHKSEHLRALHKRQSRQHNSQRVLPLPPRPQRLIGREPVVKEVIDRLCMMDSGLYAITGLPGVGKSTLASEVVHRLATNEQMHLRAFSDGIAAFTCTGRRGRSGLLSLLADVIAFFGPYSPSYPASSSNGRSRVPVPPAVENDLASMLDRARLVLADKHALILLDGVDEQFPLREVAEALLAQDQQALLQQKGSYAGYAHRVILTTGCFIPPPALAAHHLHLEPLEPDAALEIFTELVKCALSIEEVQAAKQVCASVGYLPLAIESAATAVSVEGIPLPFLAAHVVEHPLDDVLDGGYLLRSRLAQALSAFDAQARRRFAFLSMLGLTVFDLENAAAALSGGMDRRMAESGDSVSNMPIGPASELLASTHAGEGNAHVDEVDPLYERLADTIADLGQFVRHSLIELAPFDEPVSPDVPESALSGQRKRFHLHPLVYAHSLNMLKQSEHAEVQTARYNVQAYAPANIDRLAGATCT
ncbi:MAG: ATP-binding protein [Ktedonobacteraceae bacterium]